jgi:hypothetical protein
MKLNPDRKLHQNTIFGLRHRYWTYLEAIAYFLKGVTRELGIAPVFLRNSMKNRLIPERRKKYIM